MLSDLIRLNTSYKPSPKSTAPGMTELKVLRDFLTHTSWNDRQNQIEVSDNKFALQNTCHLHTQKIHISTHDLVPTLALMFYFGLVHRAAMERKLRDRTSLFSATECPESSSSEGATPSPSRVCELWRWKYSKGLYTSKAKAAAGLSELWALLQLLSKKNPSVILLVKRTDLKNTQSDLKNDTRAEYESEAEGVVAGQAFRKFLLLFDRLVLVERTAAETVTKGGIMLPEKSQGKVLQAIVVAVGLGCKGKGGEIQPVSVKVGDKVLLPECGGTKVVLGDKDYFLFRDGDILDKYVD
ncbi:PREDICTED: uncharacterized protein LOC105587615 [Cercocebus atys]|uniref:uncharacterized protein LOC105587615 n=1 Tax=Cercocebus atys TaxID=9531 RepID=UPI0005F3A1C8|nr:PREDICTED: uncharacterized protein LOC105587615 [Cercocebus atys]